MATSNKKNNSESISIDLAKATNIYTNLDQVLLVTTADKMEIILTKSRAALFSKREWGTPLGLFISFVTTLSTSEFKCAFGYPKEFWKALFLLLSFVSLGWLIWTVIGLVKNHGKGGMEDIINQIKAEGIPISVNN